MKTDKDTGSRQTDVESDAACDAEFCRIPRCGVRKIAEPLSMGRVRALWNRFRELSGITPWAGETSLLLDQEVQA